MRRNSISIRSSSRSSKQRVTLLETLKRKYGGSIPEVIAFGERAAERMRKIEGRDAELERLAREIERAQRADRTRGTQLAQMRAERRAEAGRKTSASNCAISVSGNRSSKRKLTRLSTSRASAGRIRSSCSFRRIRASR